MVSRRDVAFSQGMYFLATGVWPLVHMRSFEAVTGSKTDRWLVRTVGVLVSVIGGVLVGAAARDRVTPEIWALGITSAVGLGAVDTVSASRGIVSPVYLVDSAIQGAIAAGRVSTRATARANVRLPALSFEPPKF